MVMLASNEVALLSERSNQRSWSAITLIGRLTGVALPSARDAAQPRPAVTEIGFRSPSGFTCLALGAAVVLADVPLDMFLLTEREAFCFGSPAGCMAFEGSPVALPDENAFAPC